MTVRVTHDIQLQTVAMTALARSHAYTEHRPLLSSLCAPSYCSPSMVHADNEPHHLIGVGTGGQGVPGPPPNILPSRLYLFLHAAQIAVYITLPPPPSQKKMGLLPLRLCI